MIIGITGPSGAGKSIFCKQLEEFGVLHIDADAIVHDLYQRHRPLQEKIKKNFPSVCENQQINRKKLAAIVFRYPEKKAQLEKLIFPYVLEKIEILTKQPQQHYSLDAPTLIESGAYNMCDIVLCIYASLSLQKKRIIQRDAIKSAFADIRINAQPPFTYYLPYAAFCIENTGSLHEFTKKAKIFYYYFIKGCHNEKNK